MGDTQPTQGLTLHPLRSRVLAEVHARPFVPVEAPRRLLHFAFMTDADAARRDRQALDAFCTARAVPGPRPGARHHHVEVSPGSVRWEQHGEFTTYTWDFPCASSAEPFLPAASDLLSAMQALPQPGPLMVQADLHMLSGERLEERHRKLFVAGRAAASAVDHGGAVVTTDFHSDAFGFVRILVLNATCSSTQLGALSQRLLEIETYRTLALLGLPEAQDLGPALRHGEAELPNILTEMLRSEGFSANKALLERLTALAAELESGAAKSAFRFGATRAYYELMTLRLHAIDERPASDLPTLGDFLSRRLTPAIRTCAATETRQEALSRKLARAAELLRTRVDVELESQNSDVLRSMNARARLQLRLQQTVEGLSIAAVTYYIASIIHIVFEGVRHVFPAFEPGIATAIAVPFIILLVGWTVHSIRARYHDP